jgi:hypothetical protein
METISYSGARQQLVTANSAMAEKQPAMSWTTALSPLSKAGTLMIKYIHTCLNMTNTVLSDLEGFTVPGVGTILKPVISVVDVKNNIFNSFELTCPMEPNIKKRNVQKN